MNAAVNAPAAYQELSTAEREVLYAWIHGRFEESRRVHRSSSYGLKHEFERSAGGFYVTNGQFKGAMRAAGFPPVEESVLNWRFRIKERRT